ncbi:Topoisomerase ii-associated protein domain-containing protein [Pandoravirus kuranda]|uniref:Topoisomerase ii-associated protein domain-containing protein n=1 Tax=Pandoravirus kuranda TaxID=3019033 RepID=A0AA95J4A0_9VIRU|nr:Topoisomerase ii-associated protein domain-containing protein [Pandoravirus kuranda]
MSTHSSASNNNGALRRRRRAGATRGAPRPHAAGARGTMALIVLLAVILVMVVIYLVRRLANVERTVKRTLGEVRHQVTPDDLHTAFGQWAEANPGQVTAACAPYIDRSVAVAADVIRARVVAAAAARAQTDNAQQLASSSSSFPPPQRPEQSTPRDNTAQPPVAQQAPPPPSHGGGPVGQHADPRRQQYPTHQGHQQSMPQGRHPPGHVQHHGHPQGAAPFQPQGSHLDQHRVPPLHAQGRHAPPPPPQQHVHQGAQSHGVQPRPATLPVFASPPSRSLGHTQSLLNSAQSFALPYGDDAVHPVPGKPAVASVFATRRPNVRCEGDVCVVVEDAALSHAADTSAIPPLHQHGAQEPPASSPAAAPMVGTLRPGGSPFRDPVSPRAQTTRGPDAGDDDALGIGARQEQRTVAAPSGGRHVTLFDSPAPRPLQSPLDRGNDRAPDVQGAGGHDGDLNNLDDAVDTDNNNDNNDNDSDHRNDGDITNDGVAIVDDAEGHGRDSDSDIDRDRHAVEIASTSSPRYDAVSNAAADPWSLPDESRFFMGRGDESDDDDEDQQDDEQEGEEEGDGRRPFDADAEYAYDDHDDPYRGDAIDNGGSAWYARQIVSAPLFLVLRASSDNGIAAPSGGARIVPLDDDDDDNNDADDAVDGDVDDMTHNGSKIDTSDGSTESSDAGDHVPANAVGNDDGGEDGPDDAMSADIHDDVYDATGGDLDNHDDAVGGGDDLDHGDNDDDAALDVPDDSSAVDRSPTDQPTENGRCPDEVSCVVAHDRDAVEPLEERHVPAESATNSDAAGTEETDKDEPTDTTSDSVSSDGEEAAALQGDEEGEDGTDDSETDE